MLKAKIDDAELALVEILEDPVWLNEFLRSTNNGDMNRSNWPHEEFSFRPYQKEILTDQSRHVVVTGGRAIGKCQPASAKVFTNEGYKTITELLKKPSFVTYGYSVQGSFTQRRAFVRKDKWKRCYSITTKSGNMLKATDVHPVMTPKGFILMADLQVGDLVAVMNKLPTDHCVQNTLSWAELRILGYLSTGSVYFKPAGGIIPRYKRIDAELKEIANSLYLQHRKDDEGRVFIERMKAGGVRHYLNQLKIELGAYGKDYRRVFKLDWLKTQKLENIRTFFEAAYAQHGDLALDRVAITLHNKKYVQDWQELLLYFGVKTKVYKTAEHTEEHHIFDIDDSQWVIESYDRNAARVFWSQFKIPGVSVNIKDADTPDLDWYTWEPISSKQRHGMQLTYSIHVYTDETYISENIIVHNSVILEDLITYQVVNSAIEFPRTPEQLMVTPNSSQLNPILDKVILKFTVSPLLKDFLNNNVNRSKGTLDFQMGTRRHRLNARIAGSRGENNLVGLHIPKIMGDEFQLFPMPAFDQMQPTLNTWEPKVEERYFGVPNGMRNTALYVLDIKTPKFKKYRIPAPNNPYFTKADWDDAIVKFGGESSDIFQQLILGKHGSPSFQVISRDQMKILPFDFYSYRYSGTDKDKGKTYQEALPIVKIPKCESIVFSIDTGFSDPTIIQVIGLIDSAWHCLVRYRVQRIDYPEQEKIIDYLSRGYNPSRIAIDVGAGGGGAGIVQSLKTRPEFASGGYANRLEAVQFNEKVGVGTVSDSQEITESFKAWATTELIRQITNGTLVFSEIDAEGISQLERVARQRRASGHMHYYVVSPRGHGESNDDHIYASYLCFIGALRVPVPATKSTVLAKSAAYNTTR
jgi:Intein splicing domain